MGSRLICTNCKHKYRVSRWHHKVPTRCRLCGGMLTGDLTAYHKHVVAHPTRYDGGRHHTTRSFAKVAVVAFLFGVLLTAVVFTWYRNTQVPRLMTQLGSEDEAVWTEAMESLIEMGQRSVPALVDAISSEDQALRERAVRAIERLGDKAVEPLVSLMSGRDETLSGSAAVLLPRVSSRQAIPRLRKLYVAQESPAVRSAILDVFEQHPDLQLLPSLVASLRPSAEDDAVQALNQRVDALCRRILEDAAEKYPNVIVPSAPAQLDGWGDWLREHRQELNAVVDMGPPVSKVEDEEGAA